MTSIVKFTPLSGAHDEKPLCYLLEIDEFKILLDCGWDEHFNTADLKLLKGVAPNVDAVLLSHPDLAHLGALSFAVAKLKLNCKVYSTNPVKKMGKLFMYDAYQSRHDQEEFTQFTPDDIDATFDNIIDLRYVEERELTDRDGGYTGIKIEPQQAGHMIGGTIWKITKDSEEIIYAVDYNHGKERHLDRGLLDTLTRPSLLITDAKDPNYKRASRKHLDNTLLEMVLNVLRSNGNVLIATDTAGRVLEMLLLLEQKLRAMRGASVYSLLMLNHVAPTVLEFAATMIEFTAPRLKQDFEKHGFNPFDYEQSGLHSADSKLFRICHTMDELESIRGPKVVLTSQSGFESGFGRRLFLKWSKDPNSFIYFTGKPAGGTLGRMLADNKYEKSGFNLVHKKRVPLEGAELEAYLAAEKKLEEEKQRMEQLAQEEAMVEDEDADSVNDSDDDDEYKTLLKHDLMAPASNKLGMDFFKQAKHFDMFPCVDDKLQWDDYGEIIRPEDYFVDDLVQAKPTEATPMEVEVVKEIPTKCIESTIKVDIKCTIGYSDFSGLSDREATMRTLKHIKPRSLILIHGKKEDTIDMEDVCAGDEDMNLDSIFSPRAGECINVKSHLNIYQVKLTDALMTHQFGPGPNMALSFSEIENHGELSEIAWINGVIDYPTTRVVIQDEEKDGDIIDEDATPLGVMPELQALHSQGHKDTGHAAVFIGDLRLSDFKPVLEKAGISAIFSGGMLICNGCVAVKKTASSGQLSLEGNVCDTYYAVRDLLYGQFAIV